MATSNRRPSKSAKNKRQEEVEQLQQAAQRLPGVADLIQLYQQHAKTVQRAGAYQIHADRRIIITSGASSA